ncbi:MAG: hypothetical protein OWS74_06865, partial [Firmicutes bacterium]|nr:hypothetical protein [Bacillota bacterium]
MEICGFIGESGTGKSHRATEIALKQQCDGIIDDGLLIVQGKIVAGRSAKREQTKIAAIRRAILTDHSQAEDIRQVIQRRRLQCLLILGTSRQMVQRIVQALHQEDAAIKWLAIEDVTTAAERDMAHKIRKEQGKHVIPAPTMEVRPGFSGYFVAPLIFFLRRGGKRIVVEKSIVRPTYSML